MLTARLAASLAKRGVCIALNAQQAPKIYFYSEATSVLLQPSVSWTPIGSLPTRLWSSSASDSDVRQKLEQAGSKKDLSAVLGLVESSGEQFDNADVEAALMQVERCTADMSVEDVRKKVHKTKTFQLLADMAVSTAGGASPAALARTLGVCGRLGCDEMVLDTLARNLMSGVDELKPEQMQQLVQGLKQADHSPGVLLLDAIQERLQGLGGDVKQQQADSIKEGLRDLGHEEVQAPNPEPQEQTERSARYT